MRSLEVGEERHPMRREEGGLAALGHGDDGVAAAAAVSVGVPLPGGHGGHQLVGADADGDGEPDAAPRLAVDAKGHVHRRAEEGAGAGDVEIGVAVAAGLDDRRVAAEDVVQRGGGAGVELRVGRQEHQVGAALLGLAHRHAAGDAGGLRLGREGQHRGAVGAGGRHRERPSAERGRHERLHGGAEGGGVDEEDGAGHSPLPPSSPSSARIASRRRGAGRVR